MTNQVQTLEGLSFKDLALLTGANVRDSVVIPKLIVNREPEDEHGTAQPMGQYCLTQNNIKVFAPKALFRTFINAYQYSEYSPTERKFLNRSLIIKSFNEEPLDELGGKACGKIPFKLLAEASAEEQLRQRNIKCRRLMYGLVSLQGTEVESVPCLWKLAGGGFMAPNDALNAITKMKHQFFQHNLELSTKRQKTGTTIYYEVLVNPLFKEELRFTDKDMEHFAMFQDSINIENSYISKKWREAKQADVKALAPDYLKELELNDPVDDL